VATRAPSGGGVDEAVAAPRGLIQARMVQDVRVVRRGLGLETGLRRGEPRRLRALPLPRRSGQPRPRYERPDRRPWSRPAGRQGSVGVNLGRRRRRGSRAVPRRAAGGHVSPNRRAVASARCMCATPTATLPYRPSASRDRLTQAPGRPQERRCHLTCVSPATGPAPDNRGRALAASGVVTHARAEAP
jgi:hypothetical protein